MISFLRMLLFSLVILPISSAEISPVVEVYIEVWDGNFGKTVTDLSFDHQTIEIPKNSLFNKAKVKTKLKKTPGEYLLEWNHEKGVSQGFWDPETSHEKVIHISPSDNYVHIVIKGSSITVK